MRRLDRRSLLKTGAAAGILAATGLPMHAAPKRGGVLRLGVAGAHSSDSWDSRRHIDAFMVMVGHGAVFDTLTQIAASGELIGELAESWEASADAKSWTFKLRKGVEFHNGKPFEAEDVIDSLRLHLDANAASPVRAIVSSITEMQRNGAHEVQFTLAAPNADFPFLLADYHLCIYPAGHIAEAMQHGIGTGLYQVIRFEPGKRAMLARVKDHYKDGKEGWFDAVELIAMNDPAQRMNALMRGQVDAVNQVDLQQKSKLLSNSKLKLAEVTGNQHFSFPMRADQAPFHDINLRRALKHAINRPQLVQSVLNGHGQVAHDHPIGPANQYYAADLTGHNYDPDKARHYLRRAGVSELDLQMSDVAFPGAAQAADLFRASAADAGVTVHIQPSNADGYWQETWANAAWRTSGWSGRATEDWMFSASSQTGAAWNETQWDNAHFQQLLLAARAELSTSKRRAVYHEMQALMSDEGGALIPMFANFVDAHHSRLTYGAKLGNLHQMDSGRMIERWWFT